MKKISFLVILLVPFILLGTGCKSQLEINPSEPVIVSPVETVEIPEEVSELENQPVLEVEKETVEEEREEVASTTGETILFIGSWFDIEYPEDFTASPTEPSAVRSEILRTLTDEAKFLSPDETVEFFVFSPLWDEDPEDYLEIKTTETLVSEKTEKNGADDTRQVVTWVTVKANNGSYYRSWVSIREDNFGSPIHHVFGIKYQDSSSYKRYRDQYITFKNSLHQYAD